MFKTTKYLLIIFVLSHSVVFAAVYKWTDKDGNIHYSDKPVNKKIKKFKYDPSVIGQESFTNDPREQPLSKTKTPTKTKKQQTNINKPFTEQQQKKQVRYCREAKEDLNITETSQLLYDYDKNGKRFFLDEKQRKTALTKKRLIVAKWCKKL